MTWFLSKELIKETAKNVANLAINKFKWNMFFIYFSSIIY